VAEGGIITFSCDPRPVAITMTATAKIVHAHRIVIDGGKVILSGGSRKDTQMTFDGAPQARWRPLPRPPLVDEELAEQW
jgi:hypothetical protein